MSTLTHRRPVSVSGLWLAVRRAGDGLARAGSGAGVGVPVAIVALVLALLIGQALSMNGGSVLGLIEFGRHYLAYTHPPAGVPGFSPDGYDGQFYWIQAGDPLLLHAGTLARLSATHPDFMQRLAYPAFAFLLAGGQRAVLPYTMLAVNVLAVLGITWAVAAYARDRGRSPMWALAVGLTPGLLMPVLRDLTDPLATCAMLGGLLAWEQGRRWWAAALLATAALAREPMVVALVAVGVDAAADWWRTRDAAGWAHAMRQAAVRAWPVLVVPAVLFVAWQAYLRVRYVPGATVAAPAQLTGTWAFPPFAGLIGEPHLASQLEPAHIVGWNMAYVALLLVGGATALQLLRRDVHTMSVAAALMLGVLAVIPRIDSAWPLTRYGAPLLVTLLVAGLRLRSRSAVAIPVAAAVLSLWLPLVIRGA